MRGFAKGIIQVRSGDLEDPAWWRRTNNLASALEIDYANDADRIMLMYQCALLSNNALDQFSFGNIKSYAGELRDRIRHRLRPWTLTPAEAKKREMDQLLDDYKKSVGDFNDPAFQQSIVDYYKEYDLRAKERLEQAALTQSEGSRIEQRKQEIAEQRKRRRASA